MNYWTGRRRKGHIYLALDQEYVSRRRGHNSRQLNVRNASCGMNVPLEVAPGQPYSYSRVLMICAV